MIKQQDWLRKLETEKKEVVCSLKAHENSLRDTFSRDQRIVYERQYQQSEKRLEEIGEAIKRLEGDTYDTCEQCDGRIDPDRLAILPWATLCIECQSKNEKSRTYHSAMSYGEGECRQPL